VIHRSEPWHNMEHVEFKILKWVDWVNNQRLLEPIGDIPPAAFEELHYQKA
jgi:putative transposase